MCADYRNVDIGGTAKEDSGGNGESVTGKLKTGDCWCVLTEV